ncbi:MAG: D-tyrosyl-tRNA(Tyr) deacylase [Planctomycetes bacterium]|nr:D-tyrosyl-tRNA(Tyr) deacylase [Planctomycetota bacterium]MBT6453212.1 D-tyrosyl-tRNA(Tyr) deacylase [Planctomycetota bacterium]MBT6540781.1 D-tyrosyl-tRNA(Tyr) deacylase [Planctomycetota bacterium]MBT6783881.1 D-tyrosyl-tRNA(Tyr) deacylase [Planctomycetota bacterium]MBT6968264.1 D-tyrosyl-tRNA(Tyr) deacylase [Planctomycetota bacterium]
MRVLVQRVLEARVEVDGQTVGSVDTGLLLLVGIGAGDGPMEMDWMARKVAGLRIFSDAEGQMNLDLTQVEGGILAVSQFTLYGDCRKGRRPSFIDALEPGQAEPLFEKFVENLRHLGISRVDTGLFGADMKVHLVNDGPVTFWIEREAVS